EDGRTLLLTPGGNRVLSLDPEGGVGISEELKGEVLFNSITPGGDVLAFVDGEGYLYFLDTEQNSLEEVFLGGEVLDFALAEDGSLAVAVTYRETDNEEGEFFLHRVNKNSRETWALPVQADRERDLCLSVSHQGDCIVFLGMQKGEPTIFCYSLQGNLVWEKPGHSSLSLSADGGSLAAVSEHEVVLYDRFGQKRWSYENTDVILTDVIISAGGEKVLAYSAFTTTQENIFYFSTGGDQLPWKIRGPSLAHIYLSRTGDRVALISWREYRDEFTLVSVYDETGKEINSFKLAARIQEGDMSGDGGTMALSSDDGLIFFLNLNYRGNQQRWVQAPASPLYKPVLSEEEAGEARYVRLYFLNAGGDRLVPVSRKVVSEGALVNKAIEELIKGPRFNSGLRRLLPQNAAVKVTLEYQRVIIDFPYSLRQVSGIDQVDEIFKAFIYTLSQFPEIREIKFLYQGEEIADMAAIQLEGVPLDLSRPQLIRKPGSSPGRQVVIEPLLSESRYYLVEKEVSLRSEGSRELAFDLLDVLINGNKAFFPASISIYSVNVFDGKVRVHLRISDEDLEQALEDRNRSRLLLDAIIYTLAENLTLEQVEVYLNGEEVGSLSMGATKDYFYLNPE
ncbi:MAG TPA: GerMN domain-containing protein, partial [Firmicutes bacterium]|nr:GerMN domain-containing protein [Bacillota bacterium]